MDTTPLYLPRRESPPQWFIRYVLSRRSWYQARQLEVGYFVYAPLSGRERTPRSCLLRLGRYARALLETRGEGPRRGRQVHEQLGGVFDLQWEGLLCHERAVRYL